MSIRIEWYDDAKTIIKHIYEGVWTLEEYYALIDANYKEIETAGHRVDIINDLRAVTGMPANITPAVQYAARKAHENEGINIMVASPAYIKILVDAINRAVGEFTEVRHVKTLEEALVLIEKHRADNPAMYP